MPSCVFSYPDMEIQETYTVLKLLQKAGERSLSFYLLCVLYLIKVVKFVDISDHSSISLMNKINDLVILQNGIVVGL